MGGQPLFALNIVAFPSDDLPMEVLTKILEGGASIARKAGIPILGGHSIKDKEPKYGMVVTGRVNQKVCPNSNAQPGDILLLTKPLGLGIISTAIKKGLASKKMISNAVSIMTSLNKNAADIMMKVGVNACTDITGYGLLGHLLEMTKASKVSAQIDFDSIDFIDGARKLAYEDIIPGGTKRNYDFVKDSVLFSENINQAQKYLIADAQTSGGLLISAPHHKAEKLNKMLLEANCYSIKIGKIEDMTSDKNIRVQ